MKDLPRKQHYYNKINKLLMKSSAYPHTLSIDPPIFKRNLERSDFCSNFSRSYVLFNMIIVPDSSWNDVLFLSRKKSFYIISLISKKFIHRRQSQLQ